MEIAVSCTQQLPNMEDLYEREAVALRVVEVTTSESWQEEPEVHEKE